MDAHSIPAREETVLRYLLERNAAEAPDEVSVTFASGVAWTRQQCVEVAYEAANALRAAGVGQGDRVAVFLPNGEDFIRVWWGLCALGAVAVPVNPVFRGAMLATVLDRAAPVAVVVDAERRSEVDAAGTNAAVLDPAVLRGGDISPPSLEHPIEPWDLTAMIMTSGTTGPSKLVCVTYMYFAVGASSFFVVEGLGREDVFLIDLPMFHMAALCYIGGSLLTRTRVAIRDRPDLAHYWEVARETGATAAILLSTMVSFLAGQKPSAAEREHGLRSVLMSPLPADPDAFRERFGIASLFTTFGMSEAPSVLRGSTDDDDCGQRGYCGRPYAGYEVRLVDENDIEVPEGTPGELALRTDAPWVITPEYYGDSAGTARAWRNGWFHTGDLLRRTETGSYFYVDRAKDALRRRGEMISAFEVERIVLTAAGVAEAACVAHPSDEGVEDDVKVWLVLEEGATVDLEQVLRHCHANMPHFMVPRYLEITDALPKTPTLRVQKNLLRERGNGAATWDREDHGLSVTRHGLGRPAGVTA